MMARDLSKLIKKRKREKYIGRAFPLQYVQISIHTMNKKQAAPRKRQDVPLQDCWDTTSLYHNRTDWEKELNQCTSLTKQIVATNYDLSDATSVKALLNVLLSAERQLDKLYTYAHLIHDQDISNQEAIADLKTVTHLYTVFAETISWIQPALVRLPADIAEGHLHSPALSEYRFYLEKIFRLASHTRSPEEEKMLASSFPALEVASKAFSSLSDSEIPFGEAKDSQGESHPLSHALASLYMQSSDRELRRTAYLQQCQRYHHYRLTFANLLNGKIQAHLFHAKARNYASCLEAALFQNNIPTSVYTSLVETVKKHSSLITQYFGLKRQALNIDEFHFYDVYAPIGGKTEKTYTYDEAVDIICDSLSILGENYIDILRKGLTTDGWVDKYENLNKRSGAYSSGCYDSKPYILLNYQQTLYDISIIAHEGGHSMHSYFSRANQTFQDHQYPIFLAEIASTLNEMLLMHFLLEKTESKEEKITLLTRTLDTIFATLFRQVLFAAFEFEIHSAAEKGIPLTEEFLSNTYHSLQKELYGDIVVFDEYSMIEWARIPHFYYNFYVYQYATGIIAALCFAERILNKEEGALEQYLGFLKSGGSDFPLEILKKSGLDMAATEPILKAFSFIEKKINELSSLL